MVENPANHAGRRLFKVGVGIDNGAGLSAQLHDARYYPVDRRPQYTLTSRNRPGKDDVIDVLV